MFHEGIRRKVASYSHAANVPVQALRSKWRKVITGDEKKRIRDMLKESQGKSEYVKLFDKIAFTLGVLNIGACQYFLLNLPGWFHVWYEVVLPLMMIARYFYFKMMNWEYFMLDFCYFTNVCILVNLLFLRNWNWLSNICFIYSFGPLLMAIVVWRNSVVFHDLDKLVSIYIHMLPSMVSYVGRFHGHNSCPLSLFSFLSFTQPSVVNECTVSTPLVHTSPITVSDLFLATLGYLLWQVAYFIKTEIVDKSKLDNRPEKITSLRWLSKDLKNPLVYQIVLFARRLGVYARNEEPDPSTVKTKLVFMSSQFLYTTSTFLLSFLVKNSATTSLFLIGIIYTIAVYYGASFYIEVFSTRYQWQFKPSDTSTASNTEQVRSRSGSASKSSSSNKGAVGIPEEIIQNSIDTLPGEEIVNNSYYVPTEDTLTLACPFSNDGVFTSSSVNSDDMNINQRTKNSKFKATDYDDYFTPTTDDNTLSGPPLTNGGRLQSSVSMQALLWPD
jgi:hypothetical protein